nr:MAG TPA: hypothetical protein [Caudoviricetes sp.]
MISAEKDSFCNSAVTTQLHRNHTEEPRECGKFVFAGTLTVTSRLHETIH